MLYLGREMHVDMGQPQTLIGDQGKYVLVNLLDEIQNIVPGPARGTIYGFTVWHIASL
jgi:hypothetical protein